MRGVLPFVLLSSLALSACEQPPTRWEKPGADEKATADDLVTCRRAAQEEAFSEFPPTFPRFVVFRRYAYYDDNRFYTETRLTDFCMRNKGYTLITIQPPKTQPPASPPPG
jgi:hypothetical protein